MEELDTRIHNFELAARMQVEAMESIDISRESEAKKRMYGIGGKETDDFGMRCPDHRVANPIGGQRHLWLNHSR